MSAPNPEARIQNDEAPVARTPAKSFEDLVVWQKAHQLVSSVYRFTESFSSQEIHGRMSQLRRAAVSVSANVAEGFKGRGKGDKSRFLNIAQGSLEECRYYLILSGDLIYGDPSALRDQLTEVSKLLNAYACAVLNSRF